jgi:hypothetical protein
VRARSGARRPAGNETAEDAPARRPSTAPCRARARRFAARVASEISTCRTPCSPSSRFARFSRRRPRRRCRADEPIHGDELGGVQAHAIVGAVVRPRSCTAASGSTRRAPLAGAGAWSGCRSARRERHHAVALELLDVPSCSSTAPQTASKYSFRCATTASGSSSSASCVKPPRSTNSTVSSRRTPASAARPGARSSSAATPFET